MVRGHHLGPTTKPDAGDVSCNHLFWTSTFHISPVAFFFFLFLTILFSALSHSEGISNLWGHFPFCSSIERHCVDLKRNSAAMTLGRFRKQLRNRPTVLRQMPVMPNWQPRKKNNFVHFVSPASLPKPHASWLNQSGVKNLRNPNNCEGAIERRRGFSS